MRRLLDKVQDLLRKRLVGLGLWTESGHISKKKLEDRQSYPCGGVVGHFGGGWWVDWFVVGFRVTASRAVASALLENVEGGCWWLRPKFGEVDVQV
jgi:hypothetical protein